jgi:hypothetical protein
MVEDSPMSDALILKLQVLIEYARARKTEQGVTVYEMAIEQLNTALDQAARLEILGRLKRTLQGIDAHGYFTSEEQSLVDSILKMPEGDLR